MIRELSKEVSTKQHTRTSSSNVSERTLNQELNSPATLSNAMSPYSGLFERWPALRALFAATVRVTVRVIVGRLARVRNEITLISTFSSSSRVRKQNTLTHADTVN